MSKNLTTQIRAGGALAVLIDGQPSRYSIQSVGTTERGATLWQAFDHSTDPSTLIGVRRLDSDACLWALVRIIEERGE